MGARGDRGRGRGAGGGGRRREDHRPLPVDKRLLTALTDREPSDIIMTLANPKTAFRDALIQSVADTNILTLLLAVLARGVSCNSLPEQLNRMIVIIKEVRFFDTG